VLEYMLINENARRLVDRRWPPDYSVVKVSMFAYVLVALIWLAPWSLFAAQITSFAAKTARGAARPVADAVLLLLIAVWVPILLFLPIPSRLIYYCLPAVPPFAILAAGWWAVCGTDCYAKGRRFAAATLALSGAATLSGAFWLPGLLERISVVASAPLIIDYAAHLALSLGVAMIVGALLLWLRKTAASLGLMCAVAGAVSLYNIGGFRAFDFMWSSKRLLAELQPHLADDFIWVSEGSKEVGASAGIAWYLGQDASGRARNVYIMEDDERRPPPAFPNPKPNYLIDQARLKALWQGSQPVLFVTDFQRANWETDAPRLPDGEKFVVPNTHGGNRRVYSNRAAWERLRQTGRHEKAPQNAAVTTKK